MEEGVLKGIVTFLVCVGYCACAEVQFSNLKTKKNHRQLNLLTGIDGQQAMNMVKLAGLQGSWLNCHHPGY